MTKVAFTWLGNDFAADVSDTADDALAVVAQVAVRAMKIAGPVLTGALTGSEHAAPPDFAQDESSIYALERGGTPQTILQSPQDIRAMIRGNSVLVGSWIYYAFWVERGTSQPSYPAQPHIQPAGDAAMQEFEGIMRQLWADRRAAE